MKYLITFLVLLLPVQVFGSVTFNFYESTSDCGSGEYFNEDMKVAMPGSLDTILVVIPMGTDITNYSYFRTVADVPNNADWETGGFTVKLKVVAQGETPQVKVRIVRENSSCVSQGTSDYSSRLDIDTVGIYTFTVASKDWSAGAVGDRMSVHFSFDNALFQNPDSVWIEVGTANSSVETEVTITEPEDWTGYVDVVDTVQGEDLWDAMIWGYAGCDPEDEDEECRKFNSGVSGLTAAGKYNVAGPIRTLFRDASGKAIANLDSVHFGMYVWARNKTTSSNLIIYAVSDSLTPWSEGLEGFAYPSDGCGVTWVHTAFDSTYPESCNTVWEDSGATYRTAVACTIAVADSGAWYWATDFIRLMDYIDTAISYEYWDIAGGFIVIGDEGADSSAKYWRSSEYTEDVTLRPMIIRYGKVRKFYHAKVTPGTGQTDSVIVAHSSQIDSKISIRRWHHLDDSTFLNIDLNRVSALVYNRGDTLERLITQDTMVKHEFFDPDDSTFEWLIVLTDSTGDTSFTYPIETHNLILVDQSFDTTHSVLDTFGYVTQGETEYKLAGGNKQASMFTPLEDGVMDTIAFYGKLSVASSDDSVVAFVYNDDTGVPDSLLTYSDPFEITTSLGWFEIPLTSELVFDSGSDYWLGILNQDSVSVYGHAGAHKQRSYGADDWFTPATPFDSPTQDDVELSIIAIYREWSELDTAVQIWGLDTAHYFNLFDSGGGYGSWVALHSSRAHNIRTIDGADTTWEKFFTGIAFNIERPYIFKWDGASRINKLECWLDIDTAESEITLSVPKSYLDSCTYPVVIGPTFGLATKPNSSGSISGEGYTHKAGYTWHHTAGADETIDSVCWYGRGVGTPTIKVAVYNVADSCGDERVYLSDPISLISTPSWKKVAVNISMTDGTTYVMGYGDVVGGTGRHYYLRTPGMCIASTGLQNPYVPSSHINNVGACYAVYTIGGEPPAGGQVIFIHR